MARTRPSARRRRKTRKNREKLRQAIAKQEREEAGATACSAPASTTENATGAATEAATSASAHDAKGAADTTKARRCKHRHLPDRHYYYRDEKFDRRFLALDRRINERLDINVAKGFAAINVAYQRHGDDLRRGEARLARKVEWIQHAYERDAREEDRKIAGLKRKVDHIQTEIEDLREEIANERRRTQRMMLELYESSDSQDTNHSD
ncbi:hypothetical protein FANTH_10678 [Fusarium anthophilum]|uniref:Uncharacterized protein n=1 Tax=Fusarium anthophilum TaxID=48485 RepID=A0A8H5DVX8_9HYPO|nr:hypothetical protein FANTH_10678 [Fusarium anthophilum]